MTSNRMLASIAAMVLAIAGTPAYAEQTTEQEIAELKTAQQHLQQQARATKPAAAGKYQREADRLQGVIDALERGEHVDPSAVKPTGTLH